jgi:hypothetical protein
LGYFWSEFCHWHSLIVLDENKKHDEKDGDIKLKKKK